MSKLVMGGDSLISQCQASELSTPFLSFNFVATRKEGNVPIINIDGVSDLGFPIDQAHFDKQGGMLVCKKNPDQISKEEIQHLLNNDVVIIMSGSEIVNGDLGCGLVIVP
jgi:hypothetical protein